MNGVKPERVLKAAVLAAVLCCFLLASCGKRQPQEDLTPPSSTVQPDKESSGGASQSPPPGAVTPEPAILPTQDKSEKKDILSEAEQIFDLNFDLSVKGADAGTENYGQDLDIQFYQGEPVLLWLKYWERDVILSVDGTRVSETRPIEDGGIYLIRRDGSRELLIPAGDFLKENLFVKENNGTSKQYTFVLDDLGNCYAKTHYTDGGTRDHLLKINRNGEIVFDSAVEDNYYVMDICTGPDGRSFAVLQSSVPTGNKSAEKLVEFNPDTGEFSQTEFFCYNSDKIAAAFGEGPDGIYYRTPLGIKRIEADGSATDHMLLRGTSYSGWTDEKGWGNRDFRVLVDGSVEVLQSKKNYTSGYNYKAVKETLRFSGIDKIPIVIRARAFGTWFKSQAARFNRTNDTYNVVLEEYMGGNSGGAEEYARLTSVEIASGKGPDMLYGDFMEEYICGLIDKGALVDLSDYIQAAGIKAEDYLPIAFDGLRDGKKIYSVLPEGDAEVYKIRSEVLEAVGLSNEINMERFMDALAGWKENAVFYGFYSSGELLRMFLKGSESLGGTIDWKTGTCDFNGELFIKILENAKRYGYNGRNKYPNLVQSMKCSSLTEYDSFAELGKEGMTRLGVLFDDGCYGAAGLQGILAINANSAQKDGAWEFIAYLLSEEAQVELLLGFPVNKAALSPWLEKGVLTKLQEQETLAVGYVYIDEGEIIRNYKEYTYEDMTRERTAEYLGVLEEVKCLPFHTAPVLDIVCEEAENYFNGSKSIQDVGAVIRNRVQLYLDER